MRRETCAKKTAVGNWFRTKYKAKVAASGQSRKVGERVNAFRCRHCGLYHIGRKGPHD
jgi:predicted RNA-binding Zn-ribbon protein involved in translation (DUF1610 family)